MSTTTNISSVHHVATQAIQDAAEEWSLNNDPLSPELLMLFLQKEMDSIDQSIRGMMKAIRDRNNEVKELNRKLSDYRKAAEMIRSLRNKTDNDGKLDFSGLSPEEIRFLASTGLLDPRDLKEAREFFRENGDMEKVNAIDEGLANVTPPVNLDAVELPDDELDAEVGISWGDGNWQDFEKSYDEKIKQIQDQISDINSDQDIVMIKFQDLMSKRANRINLVTNIIKKMNESADAVVGNIR